MPPTDTKYLQKRGNAWYIRIKNPPKCWGLPGEFVHTLRTPNISEARKVRDLYLMPILAESKGLEMAERILKLIAGADDGIKEKLQNLGEYLGDDSADLTISQIFQKFTTYKTRTGTKPSTVEKYTGTLKALLQIIDYDKPMANVSTRDITNWRDTLLEMPSNWMKVQDPSKSKAPKMSNTTINNHLSFFRTVWKWAKKEKYLKGNLQNPAEGIRAGASSRVRTGKTITVSDCDKLINMPFPSNATNFDKKVWNYFPVIARYTGMRINEIGQLTTEDIREEEGILCFDINTNHGKSVKADSVRLVPISEKLKDFIKPLINQCANSKVRKEIFPKRGDYNGRIAKSFDNTFNRHAKKIGSHIHFHGLRSYMTTQMANAGIDEIDRKKITGHSDPSIHAGYTKTVLSRLKKAVDCVP
ncbi:MAG: site-specific integrase [Lentisphaeraceae bacterium]|nr:site-specific integrase [Lentisphaeraceae bacterium]